MTMILCLRFWMRLILDSRIYCNGYNRISLHCVLKTCAKRYYLTSLHKKCISFIDDVIDENLCFLYYSSKLHGVDHLDPRLLNQIVLNPTITLSSHSVLRIKGS
uniref:Uncharacterized protein n=1 Tax=Lepeophtheirus salmonis TaxID=72036 RepID=A0A0K2V2D9_LEPSM